MTWCYILHHNDWGSSYIRLWQGLPFLKIFTCPTSKISFFQYQIIYDLEEKFIHIYLPDGQVYLPRAVGYVEPCFELTKHPMTHFTCAHRLTEQIPVKIFQTRLRLHNVSKQVINLINTLENNNIFYFPQ